MPVADMLTIARAGLALAAAALLFTAAGHVFRTTPRSSPTFRLALYMAAVGLYGFDMLRILDPAWLDQGYRGSLFHNWAESFVFWGNLAMVAFLWVYPRPVAVRSWQGAVAVATTALVLLGGFLWVFNRSALFPLYATQEVFTTYRVSLLYHFTMRFSGIETMFALLLLAALLRVHELPKREQGPAALLLTVLFAGLFSNLGSHLMRAFMAMLSGGVPFLEQIVERGGGSLEHPLAWAFAGVLVIPAVFAVGLMRRHPTPVMPALLGAGVLLQAIGPLAPFSFYVHNYVWLAVGALYVVSRHGLFGAQPVPIKVAWGLSATVGALMFTFAALMVLSFTPNSPLTVMLGVLVSLAVATAAALVVLPRDTPLPLGGTADAIPARLTAYRAALEAEMRDGGEALSSPALRALRGHLGITDREHALVLEQLRAEGARLVLTPGTRFLDRYRILGVLGRGATGQVWRARDERLGREVAIKQLTGEAQRDAEALQRFRDEMRLASALHHPHIAAVYDIEAVGDHTYLIMEHLPGGSLADHIAEHGPLPEEEAKRTALHVLDALSALHKRGIVHRDVKPANILFDAQGTAKLADFTVAREHVSGETLGSPGHHAHGAGTPETMAPEVARGLPGGPRSDVYSLGATLYHALTGRPLVDTEGLGAFEARMRAARAEPDLPILQASAGLNEVLLRALAKDPDLRYPDARTMAQALESTHSGSSPVHRSKKAPPGRERPAQADA